MIRSFGDRLTEALFGDERVRQFEGISRRAKRKLEAVNAASRLEDLMAAVKPTGEAQGQSERISLDPHQRSMASDLQVDQWRAA